MGNHYHQSQPYSCFSISISTSTSRFDSSSLFVNHSYSLHRISSYSDPAAVVVAVVVV